MNKSRLTPVRVMIILLALLGAVLYLLLGSVTVSVGKDSVTVSGTLASSVTMQYSDIEEYELHTHMDIGTCSFGLNTRKTLTGKYASPIYGSYNLFYYKNVHKFIMLKTAETTIIFNCPSEEVHSELPVPTPEKATEA